MIEEKLEYLIETKKQIKNAIVEKGQPVADTDTFRSYADKILQIESGGGGGDFKGVVQGTITEINDTNGDISNIRRYAFAYCSSLTTASFPSCSIAGSFAFVGCSALTRAYFPSCTSIGNNGFDGCILLSDIIFPKCTNIQNSVFRYCSSLTTANFPSCASIGINGFQACSRLTTASFPLCSRFGTGVFYGCISLTTASFPLCSRIDAQAFYGCSSLSALYLTKSATLGSVNVFTNTPMSNSTYLGYYGSIYVPASLLTWYQGATNWVTYSSRITTFTP